MPVWKWSKSLNGLLLDDKLHVIMAPERWKISFPSPSRGEPPIETVEQVSIKEENIVLFKCIIRYFK